MGFNIFRALVVDLLHEFEIGVWKMLFIHLLRIISAQDKGLYTRIGPEVWCITMRYSPHSADLSDKI